jgi:hypothetical protein
MGINYSAHGRDEKLLCFGFDALREVVIRAGISRTQENIIKRVYKQACEVEKPYIITLVETSDNMERDDWIL